MSKRTLQYKTWEYGQMGDLTNGETWKEGYVPMPIHVGDVISFTRQDGTLGNGMVVKTDGVYGVMGYVNLGLRKFNLIDIVIPHNLVTEEIAKRLHGFRIVEPKKMTIEEVEEALGYPVQIVGN